MTCSHEIPAMTKLPRLAYLTNWYPAVSLTFVIREIEALREMGAEILTCSIRPSPPEQHPGPSEKREAAATFNVLPETLSPLGLGRAVLHALGRPRRLAEAAALAWTMRPPGLKALVWQGAYLAEAMVLARHLAAHRIEHLHMHFAGGSTTAGMLAARIACIPYSFTLHGPTDLEEPARWRLGTKIAQAAFVACISHYARSQCMLWSHPTHWSKLHIVHCGVIPDLYESAHTRTEGPVRLLFAGRLAPVKGLRVLLDALSLLGKRTEVDLTIVGDGPDRDELERIAALLEKKVRFTGYFSQAEVAGEMAATDIFVLPSFAEGVPVVLMEAMASGKPVIATQVAGVGELVEDGMSGRIVPPGDAVMLAHAIADLAADPTLRNHMGAAGRNRVRTAFDIRVEAVRLAGLFAGKERVKAHTGGQLARSGAEPLARSVDRSEAR